MAFLVSVPMLRSKRRAAIRCSVGLAAAAVLLTGCAGAVPVAASEPDPLPPAPAPIAWTGCGPNLDCATVEVPLDYAEPDGTTIPLAVTRYRATDPAQRIGSLFYNPGGPGAPATETVAAIDPTSPTASFSPDLLARFDIVGMDPRGVGGSGAIRCLTDEQRLEALALDLDPTLPGGLPLEQVRADADKLADGCAANHDPAYLESLSTDNVARDMDQVRAALGEEQLTYLGVSYGTLLGATYATLFPERVRQMVLDAPADPDLWRSDPLEATVQQARAGAQALDAWFETCRAEGVQACPVGGGDPGAAFDALITQLEAQPLVVPPTPARPSGGTLDGNTALLGARFAAFDRQLWPVLTAGLLSAQQGDGTLLFTLANLLTVDPDGTPSGLLEANTAVNCMDRAFPTDIAAHTAAADELVAEVDRIGATSGYVLLACADWPVQNQDRYTGTLTGAGAPPILVVAGRLDSQTPYSWGEAMVEDLENSVLLTREGIGHGSYRTNGPCLDAAVDATLIDGVLPPAGTVCPQEPPATTDVAAFPGAATGG